MVRKWAVKGLAAVGAAAVLAAWLVSRPAQPPSDESRQPSELILAASHRDWRVRAAAFAAMDRLMPLREPLPPRDMLLADREQVLLRWMERATPALLDELCDLYAASDQVALGTTLVARCVACHAGSPSTSASSCATCHADIATQWSGSSHAQSLSHLHIHTVDPRTRDVRRYDFGPLHGTRCTECHLPDPRPRPTSTASCAYTFKPPRPTSESCAACHAGSYRQWSAWRQGPRPSRAAWPPGTLEVRADPPTATCIDCHMPGARHRLSARRDLTLLRGGLDLQLQPGGPGRVVATLTNLAGHDYPTGSTRRALLITADFTTAGPARQVISTRRTLSAGSTAAPGLAPALEPGEQRSWDIAVPPGARSLRCVVAYVRNRFTAPDVAVEILARSIELPAH